MYQSFDSSLFPHCFHPWLCIPPLLWARSLGHVLVDILHLDHGDLDAFMAKLQVRHFSRASAELTAACMLSCPAPLWRRQQRFYAACNTLASISRIDSKQSAHDVRCCSSSKNSWIRLALCGSLRSRSIKLLRLITCALLTTTCYEHYSAWYSAVELRPRGQDF